MYQNPLPRRPLPPPEFMKSQTRYRREKIEETKNSWRKSLLWGLLFLLVIIGIVVLFHVTF